MGLLPAQPDVNLKGPEQLQANRRPIETFFVVKADPDHPTYTADKTVAIPLVNGKSGLVAAIDGVGSGKEDSVKAAEIMQKKLMAWQQNIIAVPRINQGAEMLRNSILEASAEIKKLQAELKNSNVDTTVSAGLVCASLDGKRRFFVTANVGDSKVFTFEPSQGESGLIPRTKDDSLVQALVDRGMLAPEDAFEHPQRNVVFRTVGSIHTPDQVTINVSEIPEGKTVIVLAVSDGITDNIHPEAFPIVVKEEFQSTFDHTTNKPNLKAFANGIQQRALNIMGQSSSHAKSDDRCVAGMRI